MIVIISFPNHIIPKSNCSGDYLLQAISHCQGKKIVSNVNSALGLLKSVFLSETEYPFLPLHLKLENASDVPVFVPF